MLTETMSAQRTSRRTKADVVYEALQSAIMAGTILEGERLRQQEVATRWGVSQTPVREAFRRLEAEGLVDYEENRGVVVRGLPWTPPPAPIDALARRWSELVNDPEAVPGSDFP
jgi:DNA-binding GntR family transcriptional regulator